MSIIHKDDNPIENGYFDRINPDILKKIPIYSKKVLEIGCGAGALGKKILETNKRCEYYGIELSEEAVKYAIETNKIASIQKGDIEVGSLSSFGFEKGSFDCIIYGDVLEHLTDPWRIIKEHKSFLKNNGKIIASIPNIANFSIIYQLLQGQWNYQSEGLLDKTHLRFFTLSSIVEMFNSADLKIIEVEGRSYNIESHNAFMKAIEAILPSLSLDLKSVSDNTKVYQYIIVAQK